MSQLGVPLFMLLILATTFASILYEIEWDVLVDSCVREWMALGVNREFIASHAGGITWDCGVCADDSESAECLTCAGYPGTSTQCLGVKWKQSFDSVPTAMWFVGVTMTTVGYGDMTPTSALSPPAPPPAPPRASG